MLKNTSRIRNSQTFKDHREERQILAARLIFSFSLVAVLMFFLLARSWYLQVVKHDDYQTRSNNNRISVQRVAPNRGLIYDRNGVLLAENRSVYSLEVVPEKISDMSIILNKLKDLALINDADIASFNERLKGVRRFKNVLLKTKLTEKQVAIFSVNGHQLSGVSIAARLVRHYPFGKEFVHAIGYVGRINDRELARIDQKNYKATRHIGKVGIEKYYEDLLHGTIGTRTVETDAQGRVIGKPLAETPPVPGQNIRLALDSRLQLAASKAMQGYRGSVIAIDPASGDVLALVSNPGYDPNLFVTGISTKDYAQLTNSQDQPLFNRALRGLYSPGSTIKPHLGWVGLESGTITKDFTIDDPGFWVMPTKDQRIIRDWTPRGHGKHVDVSRAITQSCDPFFYELAYRMKIDLIAEKMKQFGFGLSTGIDMGEELAGIMPSREWKREVRNAPWFPGDTVNVGIGQGFWNATPLQLANSISTIATGQTRKKLRMVIAEESENEWFEYPVEIAQQQFNFHDERNLKVVRKAMEQVTRFPWGTAKTAFKNAPYQSAGKTGTVQLTAEDEDYDASKVAKHLKNNAVYVGYAPIDQPEIVLSVVVENGGHGGESAAPVARKLLDEYFLNRSKDMIKISDKDKNNEAFKPVVGVGY